MIDCQLDAEDSEIKDEGIIVSLARKEPEYDKTSDLSYP